MHDVAVATLLAHFTFRLSDRVRAHHNTGLTDLPRASSASGLPEFNAIR